MGIMGMMSMMSMIGIERTPSNRTYPALTLLVVLVFLVVLAFPVLKLPDINLQVQQSRHLLLFGFRGMGTKSMTARDRGRPESLDMVQGCTPSVVFEGRLGFCKPPLG